MTTSNAFGWLFPPALFTIVGLMMSVIWRPDPVLLGIAMCASAAMLSWLVLAVVEVAKSLPAGAMPPAEQRPV